jgi:hypothetical protein
MILEHAKKLKLDYAARQVDMHYTQEGFLFIRFWNFIKNKKVAE